MNYKAMERQDKEKKKKPTKKTKKTKQWLYKAIWKHAPICEINFLHERHLTSQN